MALSGKKFEFTVVISMWRDGVANATRGPTVRNASTGQRMHVRSLQLNIKSHVSIELNECVSGQRSRRIRGLCMPEQVAHFGVDDFHCGTIDTSDSASEEVEADMPAGDADVQAVPSESGSCKRDFFLRQGVVVGTMRVEKRSMSTFVQRIISFW